MIPSSNCIGELVHTKRLLHKVEVVMTLKAVMISTAVLFLIAPVASALAHDDDGYGDHEQFHDQLSDAHRRAHEEGFWSRAEHRAYHRALRDLHEGYHEDNDGYQSYYYARPRSYYYSSPGYYRSYRYW